MSRSLPFAVLLAASQWVNAQAVKSPPQPKQAACQLLPPTDPISLEPPNVGSWNLLTRCLHDPRPDRRKLAVLAIGSIGLTPEVIQTVEGMLQDRDSMVRQSAAAALGEMKSRQSIPLLEAVLDDVPEVSFTAAKALWDMSNSSGREIFQQVLSGERKDTPTRMQGAVRDAKRKMQNPAALAIMGIKEASGALLGPASLGIAMAQDALKDSGAPGRAIAAQVLAKDEDPYALVLLEWAVDDKSWGVRTAVAKALGQRGTRESIRKLQPLLSDSHDAVRLMTAAAIVKLSLTKSAASGQR